VHIIAYPLTITEDIGKLFAVIGEQILTEISIKTRRAIFTPLTIVLRSVFLCFSLTIPTVFCPAGGHITTINQLSNFLPSVVMSAENATQPLRITIPVVIHREHRTILEFKTYATSCSDERFLKSTNVL